MAGAGVDTTIEELRVHAFRLPTDGPDGWEEDGTLRWDSTTMVLVEATCGAATGLGYTYGDVAVAHLVDSRLAPLVRGQDCLSPAALWQEMAAALRNAGRSGVGAMALSAVDIALWDLRARLLGQPLFRVLPAFHDTIPLYGSGGFTNYPPDRLTDQLGGWVEAGIRSVKMKTSRRVEADPERLNAARRAIGDETRLFADANGALTRKEAVYWAHRMAERWDVSWFEEPVTSDDTDGLRLVRDQGPGGLDVAAGEYGYVLRDFDGLLRAQAVDCLQADVTRCQGITGLLQVAGLAAAQQVDVSAHCAPAVSAHAFCCVKRLRHLEYFHDHTRMEHLVFDGTLSPSGGHLRPATDRPGLGLTVRWTDVEPLRVYGRARR